MQTAPMTATQQSMIDEVKSELQNLRDLMESQLAALNQTIENFGKVRLAGAIVTKIDEAASLGGILTASIRHQLVLAYCGTGQKVPEDLEPAKSHRLISRAVSLMQQYGEQVDQEALALRYNHIINKNQA